MTAVNGLTLKNILQNTPTRKRPEKAEPIANVFLRLSHKNTEGVILTNRNQKKIVEFMNAQIDAYVTATKSQEHDEYVSSTFVPYYDAVLDESEKSALGEIKMSEEIADKVRNNQLQNMQ